MRLTYVRWAFLLFGFSPSLCGQVVVNMSIGFGAVITMLDERINWAQLTYPNLIFVAAAGNSNYA